MADTPKIRFKGFTDAWEQRKALELAEYSKGNGYSKGDLTELGTPIILYGRLYTKYHGQIQKRKGYKPGDIIQRKSKNR